MKLGPDQYRHRDCLIQNDLGASAYCSCGALLPSFTVTQIVRFWANFIANLCANYSRKYCLSISVLISQVRPSKKTEIGVWALTIDLYCCVTHFLLAITAGKLACLSQCLTRQVLWNKKCTVSKISAAKQLYEIGPRTKAIEATLTSTN